MIIQPHTMHTSKVYSRIVSLVPSQTELLYDLQLADEVIAITKFCVHPSTWFKNKTRIGGTKNVKIDLVKQINPDLIIANKEENIQEQVEALAGTYDILVTDVTDLKSALQMIKDVGILTGKTRDALAIARTIENKFQPLHEKFAGESKIKTAYLAWKHPYLPPGTETFLT